MKYSIYAVRNYNFHQLILYCLLGMAITIEFTSGKFSDTNLTHSINTVVYPLLSLRAAGGKYVNNSLVADEVGLSIHENTTLLNLPNPRQKLRTRSPSLVEPSYNALASNTKGKVDVLSGRAAHMVSSKESSFRKMTRPYNYSEIFFQFSGDYSRKKRFLQRHRLLSLSLQSEHRSKNVPGDEIIDQEKPGISKYRPKRDIWNKILQLGGRDLPYDRDQSGNSAFSEYRCTFPSRKDFVERKVYCENTPCTVRILVTQRPESRLLGSLLRLVLRDYLGYAKTELVNMHDRVNYNDSIEYLSDWDSVKKVTQRPMAMIQLDMLGSPHFNPDEYTVMDRHVITLGDTGPTVRLGWFLYQNSTQDLCNGVMTDHWRLFQFPNFYSSLNYTAEDMEHLLAYRTQKQTQSNSCEFEYCRSGVYVPHWCRANSCAVLLATFPESMQYLVKQIQQLKLTVQVHFVGDDLIDIVRSRRQNSRPVLFVHYTPSLLLLDGAYNEVAFPSNLPSHCGSNNNALYLHKLIWSGLKTSGALVYKIVSLFRLTQSEYESLLKTQLNNTDLSYEEVACQWMTKKNRDWRHNWIPVDKTENVIEIGGIFPISEKQLNSAGILTAAKMAFNAINSNESLLPGFSLVMKLGDGQCSPDMAIKNFIRFIQTDTFRHMAGIIGPACSNAVESIAGVARHYRTMVISYSAEGAVLSNRTRYPYFFRTIGENRQFRFVYKQLFARLGWKRLGALTESGQKYSEYITSVQDMLEAAGVRVIFSRRMQPLNISLPRYLKDIRSKDVRIIIADLYEFETKHIMCLAFRRNMTAKQGYVWFLPAWFNKGWHEIIEEENLPCTTEDMSKALDGHLALSHSYFANDSDMMQEGITVKQWRRYYSGNCSQLYQSPYEESNYAGYAYDAVWTYGLALDKLLREKRSHYRNFHSAKTNQRLFELLSATDFHGVSGHIRFKGPSRLSVTDVKQWIQGNYIKVGHFVPDTGSTEGGRLYLEETKFRWLTPDGQCPHDGLLYDCDLRGLAELIDVSCDTAIIMVNIVTFTFVILAMVLAALLIRRRYEKKVRRLQQLGLTNKSLFSLDQWEMSRDKVVLNRKLGEGAFGMVYGGEARINVSSNIGSVDSTNKLESNEDSKDSSCHQLIAVAVKTLKRHCTIEERLDFLAEADVMKKFNHENIVRLLGLCSRSEPILTVMEFMLYGDLKTFLLARRTLVSSGGQDLKDSSCEVSSMRLTAMASDVASALNYLANNNFVHRDVACRNCLVGSKYVVKLADFGMTRSLCDNDYYRFHRKGKLPVRWMAPESVRDGRFTPKSDVWSFGVLLYEIVTFGSLPYQGHSNSQVVEMVRAGYTVGVPDGVKQELRDLMNSCWNINESDRPDCSRIVDFMRAQYPRLISPCLGVTAPTVTLESFDFIEGQDLSSSSGSRHIFPDVQYNNGRGHLGKVNQGADSVSDLT